MAFSKITLALFMIYLVNLLSSSGPSPLSAFARRTHSQSTAPLAVQVCSNTSDFRFCMRTLYADRRAHKADRVVIAYIAFSTAFNRANATIDLIRARISSGANVKPEVLAGLMGCRGNYTEAGQAMMEALGNLDSDTYYGFDRLAGKADSGAKACEGGFGPKPSPMAKENGDMMKLANICSVVANLFSYSD
ncbi:plant invertase/pectin methylesterase inhibitor [Striga asiatica]|uniref:Plant invertase/pectin methylesterase inhibitor n=1 Tax=Striga asiatica TaxID=4170 RepID=A0A5A7R5W2_STRAF|nr:plant invertase/pectin methylesterase inhibitor [Striga asiatica]